MYWHISLLIAVAVGLNGCVSPIALDRATMAYNQATADILSKQLLLNIARARHNEPLHFSGVSNIAATFSFQMNAGATPALTGDAGSSILPLFGIAASESPTVSIVPMEGEEFTRRLLTPLQESKMTLLLRQNIDVDLLLRLVAQDYQPHETGSAMAYLNDPKDRQSYQQFRRVVLHLSSIQDRHSLHAEPLLFEQHWVLPAHPASAEAFQALAHDYQVTVDPVRHEYHLAKPISGQIIITNYDPALLPNEERLRLHQAAQNNAPDDLEIDIRPGYPGGEYPLRGRFRLRSFGNILAFIGKTIAEAPEYAVTQDPRTPAVSENPPFALQVLEADTAVNDDGPVVQYKNRYYGLAPDAGYPWNKTGFRLLAQIFQMTVTDLPRSNSPVISIAK